MKNQVVIIGLGRFGESVARALSNMGHDVLALDTSEQRVQDASTRVTHAVHADATNEAILEELGVRNFDIAVVAIGSDIQSSVLATILLKRLGIPVVVARATNPLHGEILSRIGADKVVFPEQEMGDKVAHEIRLGGGSDYLSVAPGYGITRLEAPADFAGKTLSDLGVTRWIKEGIVILLIQRGKEITFAPSVSETIKAEDVLVIAGSDDRLEAFLAKTAVHRKGK